VTRGTDYSRWSRADLIARLQELEAERAGVPEKGERPAAFRDRPAELFELAPLAYLLCDHGGVIRSANPAAVRLLGTDRDRLEGRPLAAFLQPRDTEAFFQGLAGRSGEGSARSADLTMRGMNGGVRTLAVRGCVGPDPLSGEEAVRLTLEDVTEVREAQLMQKRANRALRALNAANQAIRWADDESVLLKEITRFLVQDAGYVLAWVGEPNYDPERTVRVLSSAGEEAYLGAISHQFTWGGKEGHEGPFGTAIVSGKPVLVSELWEDPAFAPWRDQALAHGLRSVLVLPLRQEEQPFGALAIYSEEADSFDAHEMGLLARLADELANGLVALRAREARQRAERERDRLMELLNATPDMVSLADPDGRILYANPGAMRLVGMPPEADPVGKYAWDFHTSWSVELMQQKALPTATREGVWQGETALLDVNGREVPISQVLVAHRGEDGEVEALSTVARDLTELRRHQGELERSRRLMTLGELSSVLAHQLNQPLAAATNFAEGTLNRLEEGDWERLRYGLEQVLASTRKAGDIIWNIRNFLRSGELQAQTTDLNHLVRSLVPRMQQARSGTGHRVRLALADDLPGVSCDPILIQECLTNLFHNAVESMESPDGERGGDGQRVTIGTRALDQETVEVYVSDQGTGLPTGLRQELVQPLFTTKAGGMGLGISVCRSIVEAHEGKLWATDNAPEPGTTFHFTLPVSAGVDPKEGAPHGERA